jgi:hypothetical protein
LFEVRPVIRRALLIAGCAIALSAAGAMAFTPGLARASRSWSRDILRSAFGVTVDPRARKRLQANGAGLQANDVAQGAFCPVRPPGSEQTALIPANSEAQMTTDPRTHADVDSSAIVAESLLTPTPAICRPEPDTTPAQSSVRP